jgi:hypothetical protein
MPILGCVMKHQCPFASRLFITSLLLICFARAGASQDIKILVLNSRTSKPVQNECLNVSLGEWHGGDLIAPTDGTGAVTLHIDGNMVSADAAPARACKGTAISGPKPFADSDVRISVEPDFYVGCQEYGRPSPGEPLTKDTIPSMIPSYSVRAIRESGVFAGNSCSGLRVKAKPGELTLFVRPIHWWEKVKQ